MMRAIKRSPYGNLAITAGVFLVMAAVGAPGAMAQQPATPTIPAAPSDQSAPTTAPAPAPAPDQTAPAPVITPAPTPAPAPPPSQPSNHFYIGPEVGVFLPTSSKTSNRFGSTWYSLGLAIGPVSNVPQGGAFSFDFGVQYQSRSGNHVLLVPLGAEYRIPLSQATSAQPYAGVTADAYIVNLKSSVDNVSGTQLTGGASALIGLNVGKNTNIEARYQFVSSVKGFDFSGLSLSAGYRF